MSKYSANPEVSKTAHPKFSCEKVTIEAKINNKTSEILEFKMGVGKKLKTFSVRKGDFLSAFKKGEKYLNAALKGQK